MVTECSLPTHLKKNITKTKQVFGCSAYADISEEEMAIVLILLIGLHI